MITTDSRIHTVWCMCRDAYLRIGGIRIQFPKDTDPSKTYQWQFVTTLDNKFCEWEFDDRLRQEFINTAVRHAKGRGLLNKGLSILLQKNMLEVCYNAIRDGARRDDDVITMISRAKKWLDQQAEEADCQGDLVSLLMLRSGIGSYRNIVRWHQSNELPEVYLAVSRSCGIVMAKLAKDQPRERALLPSNARIFLARTSILGDVSMKLNIHNVMQDDWRRPCPS